MHAGAGRGPSLRAARSPHPTEGESSANRPASPSGRKGRLCAFIRWQEHTGSDKRIPLHIAAAGPILHIGSCLGQRSVQVVKKGLVRMSKKHPLRRIHESHFSKTSLISPIANRWRPPLTTVCTTHQTSIHEIDKGTVGYCQATTSRIIPRQCHTQCLWRP